MKIVPKLRPELGCNSLGNDNIKSTRNFISQCTRNRIVLSVLADLTRLGAHLDKHMNSYGPEALHLTDMLLTLMNHANVDKC
jgi:hypothetical protein